MMLGNGIYEVVSVKSCFGKKSINYGILNPVLGWNNNKCNILLYGRIYKDVHTTSCLFGGLYKVESVKSSFQREMYKVVTIISYSMFACMKV